MDLQMHVAAMRRYLMPLALLPMIPIAACMGADGTTPPPAPTGAATMAVAHPVTATSVPPGPLSPSPPTGTPPPSPPTAIPVEPTATTAPTVAGTGTAPSETAEPVLPTITPARPSNEQNPASAMVGVTGLARYFWSPATVAISPGGSVTWEWSGEGYHDVVIEAIGYSSGSPVTDGRYTFTFTAAGAYVVVCSLHPDTMRGTVTVE